LLQLPSGFFAALKMTNHRFLLKDHSCMTESRRGHGRLHFAASSTLKEMHGLGRILISIGAVILIVGICVLLAEKLNLPLGRLPGDFAWRGKNSGFYFPLTTCILLSVLLSLLFYILGRIRR
jgi:hypothetical protein